MCRRDRLARSAEASGGPGRDIQEVVELAGQRLAGRDQRRDFDDRLLAVARPSGGLIEHVPIDRDGVAQHVDLDETAFLGDPKRRTCAD